MHSPYIPDNAVTFTHQNTRRNSIHNSSAQSQKHSHQVRRSVLKPAPPSMPEQLGQSEPVEPVEQEIADDSWLNDTRISPPHTSGTSHKHVVHYEDLPTVSLMALQDTTNPATRKQAVDVDETQRLPIRRKLDAVTHHKIAASPHVTTDFNDYGPIKALLENKHVSSITAMGPQHIYVELRERCGVNGKTRQMQETPYRFQDEQHMMRVIENMLHSTGRTLSTRWSISDVRLPDGSLLSVSLPPGTTQGPTFTIRKPEETWQTLDDLIREKKVTQEMANTLRRYVLARRNICICGPASSGKTTLLNALCALIPADERIVTIEDASEERELHLRHPQVITLLTQQERDSEKQETSTVSLRDALSHAHRMRSQRIIVSHCHGDDVPALLRAMFDGGSGIMTTMNAQNADDCLSRLELLYLMHYLRGGPVSQATPTLNALLRAQIASSLHVMISLSVEQRVTYIKANIS